MNERRLTARKGGGKQKTERGRERKKICSDSLWMCSGASTIPQPIDRLCSHYSTESSEQSENGETERDPQRDVYSLGCALLCCSQQGAEEGMQYSLIPMLCALLSGRTLSRQSLSVDLPEGLDSAKFIVKLGHTAVRANSF